MLIYGSKNKQLAKEILTDKCQSCGKQNSIDMHVFQKYAHLFWIPFFPMGKTGVSQCDHCKQVLKLKEMPSSLSASYETLKAQTKTPVWMFSGLALVAVLITFGIISDRENDQRNAKLILAPQRGDVFEIKTKDNQYTLYKVDQINNDSVYVRINQYETNKSTGLGDLKRKGDNVYTEEVVPFSRLELKQMLDDGEIIDIDRK
jgi:zinc-ribbon family